MYPLMFIIKCLVVLSSGIAGILSLSRGFGLPIPFLEYGSLEAWNVIAGGCLLALSLACAFFWHAPKRRPKVQQDSYLGMADEWLGNTLPQGFKQRGR
jgi:hypothetical protein